MLSYRRQRTRLSPKARSLGVSLVLNCLFIVLLALVASPSRSSTTIVVVNLTQSTPTSVSLLRITEQQPSLYAAESVDSAIASTSAAAWTRTLCDSAVRGLANSSDYGGSTSSGTSSADFFGTRVYGQRFVYVLDVSLSMNARKDRRFHRACDELLRSIASLEETQEFYVLLFSFRTQQMFNDPQPAYAHAEQKQIERLKRWLYQIELDSGTDPRRALSIALQMKPDGIFLLSDGDFNQPFQPLADTGWLFETRELASLDVLGGIKRRFQKLPIHTIAFENPFALPDMQSIAEISGGSSQYVKTTGFEPANRELFDEALQELEASQDSGDMPVLRARLRHAKILIEAGEWVYADFVMRPLRNGAPQIALRKTTASILKLLDEVLDDEARCMTDDLLRTMDESH